MSTRDLGRYVARSEEWIRRAKARFAALPKTSRVESGAMEYMRLKKAALDLVERRLSPFNAPCHFKHGSISVRNQSSRWGSCSRRGTLSFNYRLLFLPPHLADYVIVHELCHLREMNHSKRFWEIVAQAIPDYLERRKQLRKLEDTLLIH